MKNYATSLHTPQTTPLPGYNMTKNNAGGFGFNVTAQQLLERFLFLGTEGGTYYVSESKLTTETSSNIIAYIKTNGIKVATTACDFLINNRGPKTDPGLFVLALVATHGEPEAKQHVYNSLSFVCKTSTHLFTFVSQVNQLRGWSRGLRRAVANFYLSRSPDQVAYQMVKYRNRAGFTHKDVLRLAHLKTSSVAMSSLFAYAVGKEKAPIHIQVAAFEQAQNASNKELVSLIKEYRLPWEAVPTEKLNDTFVLTELIDNMPDMALLRNLNRLTYTGVIATNEAKVITRLNHLKNIHPITLINALRTYSSGHSDRGSTSWVPNQNVIDSLHTSYENSLKSLVPTNKNIILGIDISSSMNSSVAGMTMQAAEIAKVLALTTLKIEPSSELIAFSNQLEKVPFGRRNSIDEVLKSRFGGGGTDCSIPIKEALLRDKVDAVVIFTDSETWSGQTHSVDYMESFFKKNPNGKIIEVALTSTPHTTLPEHPNVLRIVGFDASVVDIIGKFIDSGR